MFDHVRSDRFRFVQMPNALVGRLWPVCRLEGIIYVEVTIHHSGVGYDVRLLRGVGGLHSVWVERKGAEALHCLHGSYASLRDAWRVAYSWARWARRDPLGPPSSPAGRECPRLAGTSLIEWWRGTQLKASIVKNSRNNIPSEWTPRQYGGGTAARLLVRKGPAIQQRF